MRTITMIMLLFVLAFMPAGVAFAGLQHLQEKELDKIYVSDWKDYNDGHLMNIDYIGTSTEATIGNSSWTLTIHAPYGTADTGFGTAGSYDTSAAAYDTLGELCDAIHALTYYNCTLTGGKRDDDSGLLENVTMASGSYDAKPTGGYNLLIDTGGVIDTDPYMNRIGITPQSGRRVILIGCYETTDGTDDLLVYGKLRKFEGVEDGVTRNDTTKVFHSLPSVNDTGRAVPDAGFTYGRYWMEFAKDEHVVIQAADGTTTQTSTSMMYCLWIEK